MATEKKPNYTDAQVARLSEYKPGESLKALADELGKTERQVRAKLVHMGLYRAAEKPVAEPKDEGPTKKEILAAIEARGFNTEGFDGATKAALSRLRDSLPAVEAEAA